MNKIISLGYNCEIGLVLQAAGIDDGSFFRFTFQQNEDLVRIIKNNFKNIYAWDNLRAYTHDMVKDDHYRIAYHSKMYSKRVDDHWEFLAPESELRSIHQSEVEKAQYLIQKWKDQIDMCESEGGRITYIIKMEMPDFDLLENLHKAIVSFGGSTRFNICVLNLEKDEDGKVFSFMKLKRFAPISDAHDFHLQSWNRVLGKLFGKKIKYRLE